MSEREIVTCSDKESNQPKKRKKIKGEQRFPLFFALMMFFTMLYNALSFRGFLIFSQKSLLKTQCL